MMHLKVLISVVLRTCWIVSALVSMAQIIIRQILYILILLSLLSSLFPIAGHHGCFDVCRWVRENSVSH